MFQWYLLTALSLVIFLSLHLLLSLRFTVVSASLLLTSSPCPLLAYAPHDPTERRSRETCRRLKGREFYGQEFNDKIPFTLTTHHIRSARVVKWRGTERIWVKEPKKSSYTVHFIFMIDIISFTHLPFISVPRATSVARREGTEGRWDEWSG